MTKKILIIEDESDLLDLITIRLEHSGYEVIPVKDAEQALAVLDSLTPDMFIIDLFLPGMQGGELCKKIRSNSKLAKIPIVIYSSNSGDEGNEALVEELEVNAFILKPYDPEKALELIKSLL